MPQRGAKYCVYCGALANTKDHCPPKLLLERQYPPNLKTVPACRICNEGFSLDEEYFRVVLAQIGTTPTLRSKVAKGGDVDRALANAPGLDERILNSLWVEPNGRVSIQPEMDRINRVVQKIALGLYFLRYKRVLPINKLTPVGLFPQEVPRPLFSVTYTESFKPKRWTHVQRRIFSYIIVQDPVFQNSLYCIIDFHQILWGVVKFSRPGRRKAAPAGESSAQLDLLK